MVALTSFVLCISSAVRVLMPQEFVFAFDGDGLRGEAIVLWTLNIIG